MSEIPQPEDIYRLTKEEGAGNLVGGVGLATLSRLTQGKQGERKRASA